MVIFLHNNDFLIPRSKKPGQEFTDLISNWHKYELVIYSKSYKCYTYMHCKCSQLTLAISHFESRTTGHQGTQDLRHVFQRCDLNE